jgi:CBS domain-containing protein
MRAHDLQIMLPTVDRTTTVARATRIIADTDRVGVILADENGTPQSAISALDVLRLALPDYVIEDPSLAGVLDEGGVSDLLSGLGDHTIGDLIEDDRMTVRELAWVDADATVIEIAAVLVSQDTMITAVRAAENTSVGVVTLPIVVDAMLEFARGQGQDLA